MKTAYVAYEQLHMGDAFLAVFWDRAAAYDFVRDENNEYEAEVVAIEEVPLVDHYGIPCRLSDLAVIAPWIIGTA